MFARLICFCECYLDKGMKVVNETEKLKKIVGNLSDNERKNLMDSNPEEIAKEWEQVYEIPIKQSKFFLNNIFFKNHNND